MYFTAKGNRAFIWGIITKVTIYLHYFVKMTKIEEKNTTCRKISLSLPPNRIFIYRMKIIDY